MSHLYEVMQRVVCVDTNWAHRDVGAVPGMPVIDSVYTIREIVKTLGGFPGDPVDDLCFRFFEIQSIGCFYHWHFRPIKETRTDISALTALLVPKSTKVATERVRELENA